mgnify:CR=1 FL=1
MKNWDKILKDFAHKCGDGGPDMTNSNHLAWLRESILKYDEEFRNNIYALNEFIGNLREGKKEDWWSKLTPPEQADYIKKHPGSKKAVQAKKEKEKQKQSQKSGKGQSESESANVTQPTKEQSSKESKKAKRMETMVDLISREKSITDEAGSSSLNEEDAQKYSDYLETINTPEGFDAWVKEEKQRRQDLINEHGPVNDETINKLDDELREELCGKSGKVSTRGVHQGKKNCPEFTKLYNSISTKGGPPDNEVTGNYPDDMVYPEGHSKAGQPHPYAGKSKKGVRYQNVLKAYLETGGVCPITKEVVPLQDMQLDHIVSLDNGGKDEPGNWMFTKTNINQFKSSKENPAIQADLEEILNMTDEEWESKEAENKFKNYKKKEQRAFWRSRFASGAAHPTEEQLNKMSKDEVDAFVYAYNETVSEDEQISRYGTQKKEVTLDNGEKVQLTYARGEGGNAIRPLEDKPETWGLYVDEDTGEVKQDKSVKSFKDAAKKYKAARGSGGRGKGKQGLVDAIVAKGLVTRLKDDKATNEIVDEALENHRKGIVDSPEKQRLDRAKEKVKKLSADGKPTGVQMKKKVDSQMKQWNVDNPPPTTEKVKTGEDESGNPIYTDKKLPVGKNGKITKAGKRSKAYKDWEKKRDEQEYRYYRQEFYNTLGQEV